MSRDLFRDDQGFTTLGMTVSLLLCLSLILSSVQVYRINSASAAIQDTADAAALAAQTEVAEFMVAAQVCDAVLLSLSLASSVSAGVGVACLCTPFTAPLSSGFVEAGKTFAQAKSSFSKTAKTGLQAYQRALPFIAAARAAAVARSNSVQGTFDYHAVAVCLPLQGEDIDITDDAAAAEALFDQVEGESEQIKQASEEAETAAQEALEAKRRGFEADCGGGDAGAYCMRERASSLTGMTSATNPYYASVDTWSFSVALERARAYYRERLDNEWSASQSASDQSQSAVRRIFYRYACQELDKGYVHETESSFDAYFPVLPKNMKQMRQCDLYGAVLFPITAGGDALVMHGGKECSCAAGYTRLGSVQELETNADGFEVCPACGFIPESMGNVASATSSVKTGFEYHYLRVAQAASEYQKAREELDPLTSQTKSAAQSLFDACKEYAKNALSDRIQVSPPGQCGSIAVVFDSSSVQAPSWQLANGAKPLGARVAVAGAALMEDVSEDGSTVLSGVFDGLSDEAKTALGPASVALRCWSGLLEAYGSGQEALSSTIKDLLDGIPFVSASGLGTWAEKAFQETMELLGLQPAHLKALKPVIANTGGVASACDASLAQSYVQVKQGALEGAAALDGVLAWSNQALSLGNQGVSLVGDSIEITSFCPFGDSGPCFTLRLPLPARAQSVLDGAIGFFASGAQGFAQSVEGMVRWR